MNISAVLNVVIDFEVDESVGANKVQDVINDYLNSIDSKIENTETDDVYNVCVSTEIVHIANEN